MGGASSKVRNVNNQTYINESDVSILNKVLSNNISNTVISNAAKCGAGVIQNQAVDIHDLHANGDINIGPISQYQDSALSFSCSNTQETKSEIANQMLDQMLNKLQQDNSTDIMAELEAAANAAVQNGWLSTPGGGARTNSDNQVNFTVHNETYQELQNIIERSIENNFTQNNIAECNSQVNNSQAVAIHGLDAGGNIILAGVSQEQGADLYANCIQNQDITQDITNSVTNAIGVEVENTNSGSSETSQSGDASSEVENRGPFESFFGSLGDLFGSCGCGGGLCGVISCVICVILICSLCLFAYQYIKSMNGGELPGVPSLVESEGGALVGGGTRWLMDQFVR